MKSKGNYKREVAFKDNTTSVENLPYPNVFYPGFYGAFFGFQGTEESSICLCTCSQKAIQNYIKLKLSNHSSGTHDDPHNEFILSSYDFPMRLIGDLLENDQSTRQCTQESVFKNLIFKDNLCHECNNVAPSYRYCHEMYGGEFKQTYGWYIKKQCYEFGVSFGGPLIITENGPDLKGPYLFRVITSECPVAILTLLKSNVFHKIDEKNDIVNYEIDRNQMKEIHHIIENAVRIKFGHKNVGESWVHETILFNIVKKMYPEFHIIHHYRPGFLNGLEIDVFIQELSLGIEYQGIQHFKPLKHLGGKDSYEKLKIRDELKRTLCQKSRVHLIYVNYDEDVSELLLKTKISETI
jgi:hypothetical protein